MNGSLLPQATLFTHHHRFKCWKSSKAINPGVKGFKSIYCLSTQFIQCFSMESSVLLSVIQAVCNDCVLPVEGSGFCFYLQQVC